MAEPRIGSQVLTPEHLCFFTMPRSEDKSLQYTYGSGRKDVPLGAVRGGKHLVLPWCGKAKLEKMK